MSLKDIIVKIIADDQTKVGLDSATKNMRGMEAAATSLTKHLAGLVTVGTFVGLAKGAIDMGGTLDDMSKKFGVTGAELSELQYVAKMSGVEVEGLGKAFKFLNKSSAESEDASSKQAAAFSALGISLEDVKSKSPKEMFDILADKFSELKDGANKTQLALALFGRSGADLLPVLSQGSKGLRAMREEGAKLGATLTDEEIMKLDRYGDTIAKIGLGTKITAGKLMIDMVDGVKGLWESIEKYGPRVEEFYARIFGGREDAASVRAKYAAGKLSPSGEFVGPSKPQKDAPNLEAIKKANAERVKAAEDLQKTILKNEQDKDKEAGKIAHDALAAEMGMDQEYTDLKMKERARENEEFKKTEEEETALLQKRVDQELDMLAPLQDAQREEMEITQQIGEYRAEDAFNAAMNYGNAAQALQLLNDGLYEHFKNIGEAQERVSSMGQLYNTVFRGADGLVSDLAQASIRAFNSMEDAVVEFAMTGKLSFKEFANSVIADLMRIAARQAIVQPIAQGIMGAFGIAPLPAMATGGPVIGGMPYMVGERGPELFVPSTSGGIVPNGGGGGNSVTVNIRNQSGEAVAAKTARASFDPQGWVIDVVLDGLNRNVRGLRTAMGGA